MLTSIHQQNHRKTRKKAERPERQARGLPLKPAALAALAALLADSWVAEAAEHLEAVPPEAARAGLSSRPPAQ